MEQAYSEGQMEATDRLKLDREGWLEECRVMRSLLEAPEWVCLQRYLVVQLEACKARLEEAVELVDIYRSQGAAKALLALHNDVVDMARQAREADSAGQEGAEHG